MATERQEPPEQKPGNGVHLRAVRADEMDAFFDATALPFADFDDAAERAVLRELLPPSQTLAAFDGPKIVGTAGMLGLDMTLPGTVVPVAGVTVVGVAPTHRRQGIARAMMTRQLHDLHESSAESIAALWASEFGIYGRYGYGLATTCLSVSVPTAWSAFRPGVPFSAGRLRLADEATALPHMAQVYERVRRTRPGHYERNDGLWALRLLQHPADSTNPLQFVLLEAADGTPEGYAIYTVRDAWVDDLPDGTLTVREAMATSPAGHAAVWRYLLDTDLMARAVHPRLAGDDALLHLLADPRRATPKWRDAMWVRLVDVDRALAARSYAREVDVVLDVADPVCPWNAGRWRLSGDETGAVCARTGDPAELRLSATELGAAFLGGTGLAAMAAGGLVEELRPGSLAVAGTAFSTARLPYCPMTF